jgi:hypothetical protein
LRKRASLAPTGSQILQIETKEMSVNAGQKINERRHGHRTFKHRAKQAVGTIFNLYDNDGNKKKKAPAVVYDSKTSDNEDNHSDDKIYESSVKEVRKRRWKNNHPWSKSKRTRK